MHNRKHYTTVITMIALFISLTVSAGEMNKTILAQWQHKELIVQNREGFSNELRLINPSSKSIRVSLAMNIEETIFFTKKLPASILLNPQSKITIRVAGIRLRENAEPLIFNATITTDSSAIKTSFILLSEKMKTSFKAVFDKQIRYFNNDADTILVPVKMQNYSAQKQFFSYAIKDEAYGLDYILEAQNPWLEAYETKMFLLKIFRNEKFKAFLNYKMNVGFFDQDKNAVLQSFIPIQSISAFYRMKNPTITKSGELAIEYRSLKDVYQVSEIRYADKIKLNNSDLSFQIHHQYYPKQKLSQLSNSYIHWNDAHNIVRAGEVYATGELSNYGNGFYLKHTQKNEEHEFWGVLNTGFIYSSVPVFSSNKKTFAYNFTKTGLKTINRYELGYVNDVTTGGSGFLFHAKQYRNIPGGRIEAGFAYSTEFSKLGPQSTFSMATEMLYRQQFAKWMIESAVHLAGRHYLGQNRGQNMVSTRVHYLFSKQKQLNFGQYWENSNPEYYINFLPRQSAYYRLFSEYLFHKPGITHTAKIQYQNHKLGNFYFSDALNLHSTLLGYQIDYRFKREHFLAISSEIALQKLVKATEANRFIALRAKASWRYRNFSSRVTWQNGVFDLNQYSFFHPDGYEQAEWLTQYRIKLIHPQLSTDIQYGLYKENFYEGIRSRVVLDLHYQPTADVALSFGITKLANFFWQQPEYKIGLTYKPQWLKHSVLKTIRIRAFHDTNGNTKKDNDEEWTPNVHMELGGRTLRTDQDGMIRVANIPKGNHLLTMQDDRTEKNIEVNRNTEMYIPVDVKYQVKGRLILAGDTLHIAKWQQVNNIIYFKSNEGVEYITATAFDGSFSTVLPKGKYNITVKGLKDSRLSSTNEKYINIDQDVIGVNIKADIKGRKLIYQLLAMQ